MARPRISQPSLNDPADCTPVPTGLAFILCGRLRVTGWCRCARVVRNSFNMDQLSTMIISHARRFIFLKTQKCAGTSVELALSQICGPDDVITPVSEEDEALRRTMGRGAQNWEIPPIYRPFDWRMRQALGFRTSWVGSSYYNHMPASKLRRSMPRELFDSYHKVTIVRNPWDREVSLYFWRYRKNATRPPFENFVRLPRFRPTRKTFDLYTIDGRIVADTVFRYETLQEDLGRFIKTLGLSKELALPRAKSSHRKKAARNYREFFSASTKSIVARRYANEIKAFGYEF
mgnify:CR=1 FL=1